MKTCVALAAVLLLAASSSQAWALDVVRKTDTKTVSGTLKGITATEVQVEKQAGTTETIPLSEVDVIFFDGEPTQLRTIRTQAANGAFDSALAGLDKLDVASAKSEVKSEVAYYKAFCKAKQALTSRNDADQKAAGTLMFNYLKDNPTSYHRLIANELLGDLSVASGSYDAAPAFYQVLEQSPFPDFKMRANVAMGRALVAQAKYPEAQKLFEAALGMAGQAGNSASVAQQQLAATLGKAVCMAAGGAFDEAIKLVQTVITNSNPEDAALQAQAYVTLGNCYLKKPGNERQALLAFMHVDVLYSMHPREHVEALKHLAKLWNDMGKPERAVVCTQTLQDRYKIGPAGQ